MHKKCIALKITIIKIITVYRKYSLLKHWFASLVLPFKLLSLSVWRLPKLLTLFSAVPPTLCNPQIVPIHPHTTPTAVDTLNAKSWNSLSLNLSLLCSCIQLTRCPKSPRFFSVLFNFFSRCMFSKYYHLLPLLFSSFCLLLFLLLNRHYYCPSFPLCNTLSATPQVPVLTLFSPMLVSFISNTHASTVYSITTI